MRFPTYDPHVLPAVREMHSHDPSVLETDELARQGTLVDEGYLDYWPSLLERGAVLDALAIEWDGGSGMTLSERRDPLKSELIGVILEVERLRVLRQRITKQPSKAILEKDRIERRLSALERGGAT
jgi:hypothetical protein